MLFINVFEWLWLCKNFVAVGSLETCNAIDILRHHHRDVLNHEDILSHVVDNRYIPEMACFLCTKPICDFNDTSCNRTSRSVQIPLYNGMLEFGFFFIVFPLKFILRTTLADDCHFQMSAEKTSNSSMQIQFRYCGDPKSTTCAQNVKIDLRNLNSSSCIFVTIVFLPNKIHHALSTSCSNSSTELLRKSPISEVNCSSPKNFSQVSQYEFIHEDPPVYDGIPLILPCSPGGYAADPVTGRFVSGKLCREYFGGSGEGIEYMIKTFYNNNENFLFPKYPKAELYQRTPIYIDAEGNILPKKLKKVKDDKCNSQVQRDGCNVTIIKITNMSPECRRMEENIAFQVFHENVNNNDTECFLRRFEDIDSESSSKRESSSRFLSVLQICFLLSELGCHSRPPNYHDENFLIIHLVFSYLFWSSCSLH